MAVFLSAFFVSLDRARNGCLEIWRCEIAPENATAYQGLSTVRLKRREYELAADAAITAVGLLHHLPRAHFNLGVAMARMGDFERAAVAFENACHIHGSLLNGHRWLNRIYSRFLNDSEKADQHKIRCRQLNLVETDRKDIGKKNTHATFDLPQIPSFEERIEILNKERPMGKAKEAEPSGRTLTIVSGLPRSGTSLMMQMLKAGGIEPKTDGERVADTDNPEGYWEWEAIKKIGKEPELLDDLELDKQAIKVISMLLSELPKHHSYKIIFMARPVDEIAASQQKMIDRLETEGANQSLDEIAKQLEMHRAKVLGWMSEHDHVTGMVVKYPELIKDPQPIIEEITKFLGEDLITNPQAMAAVVRPELYRQKSGN